MMDFQSGQWVISCDDCDEVLDTETKDREEAIQSAITMGWKMGKNGFYCEQCAEDHDD
jgi:hypothetical protein